MLFSGSPPWTSGSQSCRHRRGHHFEEWLLGRSWPVRGPNRWGRSAGEHLARKDFLITPSGTGPGMSITISKQHFTAPGRNRVLKKKGLRQCTWMKGPTHTHTHIHETKKNKKNKTLRILFGLGSKDIFLGFPCVFYFEFKKPKQRVFSMFFSLSMIGDTHQVEAEIWP